MQSRRYAMAAALILAILCQFAPVLTGAARAAEAWGEIREATRNLNIRAKRDYKSALVRTLHKGEQVKVDYLKDGWFAIFPVDAAKRSEKAAIGYSKSKYLKFIATAPAAKPESAAAQGKAAEPSPVPDAAPAKAQAGLDQASAAAMSDMTSNSTAIPAATPAAKPAPSAAQEQSGIQAQEQSGVRAQADSRPVAPAASPGDGGSQGQKVLVEVEQRPEDLPKPTAGNGKLPVRITADKLTYNDKNKTVAFSGNVEAEHEGLNLWAEELTAYFDKKGKPGEEIDRIVASGGVRMQRASTEGASSTVTYLVKENLLLMEGNPIIRDGKNTVTGKVIKFYVKENRSEVVGGNGKRVEAILFAPETQEAP